MIQPAIQLLESLRCHAPETRTNSQTCQAILNLVLLVLLDIFTAMDKGDPRQFVALNRRHEPLACDYAASFR
jgi:hypothetical protein